MSYTKTTWVNNAPPDINAANLNKLEEGVRTAHVAADGVVATAAAAEASALAAATSVSTHAANVSNPHSTTSKQVGARHQKNAVKSGAVGNDSTDNTTVLQSLLDAIRDEGGGVLYIPNDGGSIYRTKGLWVPSNCTIVSDGATLRFTGDNAEGRHGSNDGDPVSASGLFCSSQRLAGHAFRPQNITIQGLNLIGGGVSFWGSKNCRVLDCSMTDPGTAGVVMSNARDSSYAPTAYLCEDTWIERNRILNSDRNGIEVISVKRCWIRSNTIIGVTADTPDLAPGCGIELEPNQLSNPLVDIWIEDNLIDTTAGAGIGLVCQAPGSSTGINECDSIYVLGNTIRNCASAAYGGAPGVGVATRGGIFIDGGLAGSEQGLCNISGNTIRFVGDGAGIQSHTSGARLGCLAVGNQITGVGTDTSFVVAGPGYLKTTDVNW